MKDVIQFQTFRGVERETTNYFQEEKITSGQFAKRLVLVDYVD